MDRILNIRTAVNLGIALSWAQRNARLTWLDDGGIDVATGTARSVGMSNGNFAIETDDVRDCFLRITTTNGFEKFVPMEDILARIDNDTMVETAP